MKIREVITEDEQLDENVGAVIFGQRLQEMVVAGQITYWQAVLIFVLAFGLPIAGMLTFFMWDEIKNKIRRLILDFKETRKINPDQIKQIAADAEAAIQNISSPGKRRFLRSLLNKYSKVDYSDKSAILKLQRDIKNYMSKNADKN